MKTKSYNLPGFGMLEVAMYPYTQVLYDFLAGLGYEVKFHETNQLGSLRDIFPGAHHTRYEYIFLQWSLISALQRQKGLGLGSKNRMEFGKLPGMSDNPSGAEILQCLVLLSNMGHFPETFAASRALLHIIHTNRDLKVGFKTGLEETTLFKKYVDEYDTYNIHQLVALFLLKRYRRHGGTEDYVSFPINLLTAYITQSENHPPAMKRLWELYKGVRILSFLILDSLYSPIPLTLDISSIILDFDNVFEDILIKSSPLQIALRQLEVVLQDTVYMSPNALLATQRVSERIISHFNSAEHSWNKISVVRDLLEPKSNNIQMMDIFNGKRNHFTEPDWDTTKVLHLDYQNIARHANIFPNNLVEWESKVREYIGKMSCRVGAFYDPHKSLFRVAFGLFNRLDDKHALGKALNIVAEVSKFQAELGTEYVSDNLADMDNKERIYRFLLNAIFGWGCSIRLDWIFDVDGCGPFFFGRGTVNTRHAVHRYISRVRGKVSSDRLHEMELTEEVLAMIDYRGPVFAYIGSTKLRYDPKKSEDDAEFDGVLIFPQNRDFFMVVIEAKNQSHGHTNARKQLSKRLGQLERKVNFIKCDISEVQNKGAFSKLRII